jgi:tetratricopeptide (TPR) repeat protein
MEQQFGCAFNPRPSPGRCIKDPSYKKIDKQCEATNNACRLLNTGAVIPPSISTPLPALVPSSVPKSNMPFSTLIVADKDLDRRSNDNNKKLDKLSGPISAYVTEYNGKKYEFFGDAHYSASGTCPKPCNDVNINSDASRMSLTQMINSDIPCWDIAVLLSNIFNSAAAEGKWVDFYLEIPFIKLFPEEKEIKERVEHAGYLYKLYYIFYNCFIKLKCNYSTTRFHYVDVRQQYKSVDLASLNDELRAMIEAERGEGEGIPTFSTFASYEIYLVFDRMKKSINNLGDMIAFQSYTENAYIEETDRLVKDLYYSGGRTMRGVVEPKNVRLLKLYLLSDNIDADVKELMKESIASTKEPVKLVEVLVPSTLIVNRRGKNMHRIRAQLEALQNEGQGEMANKIISFILDTYNTKVNINLIMDLWTSITLTYRGLVNKKFKQLENADILLDRFISEYKKAQKLFSLSVSGGSLMMDAYTLARMFRTYSNSQDKDILQKQKENKHIDSSKSIVYAGNAHIDVYINFFETVLQTPFIKYEPNIAFLNKIHKNDPSVKSEDAVRCFNVNLSDFL